MLSRIIKFGAMLRFGKRLPLVPFSSINEPKKKRMYPDYDKGEHSVGFWRQDSYDMIPPENMAVAEVDSLRMPEIKTRILFVLNKFEKIALNDKFNWHGKFDEYHGLDSLDVIAILTSIEEEFHTVFEDNAFDNLTTFAEVADFITNIHNAY